MRLLKLTLLACATAAQASSVLPLSEEQECLAADAVCRGKITAVRTLEGEQGQPVTRAWITVEETFRGQLPGVICVENPGGALKGRGEDRGDAPSLRKGDERIFHITRHGQTLRVNRGESGAPHVARKPGGDFTLDEFLRHRRLRRATGGADLGQFTAPPVTGSDTAESNGSGTGTAGGLFVNDFGVPARWLAPDRGAPIPVIVDATALPPGITEAHWRTALNNAFAAWTAATGVTFRIEGTQTFGKSAELVVATDEKIRIQLHDSFGAVSGTGVLGIGGREWSSVNGIYDITGGMGGQINGMEFHKAVRGYIVIDHQSPSMQNVKTLEEVLCHELGHVLGLVHSSINSSEPSATLREALMYYRAHADGRGAALGTYDTPMVQKAHPLTNVPPWSSDRYMAAITHSVQPNITGVNEVNVGAYSRNAPPPAGFTLFTANASAVNGTFTTGAGGVPLRIRYTPNGAFSSSAVPDPSTGGANDNIFYRLGNGVNCSPWYRIAVVAFRRDRFPSGATDGIPDSWMSTWFGSSDPAAGPNRGAAQDFDRDGLTNLEEYQLGTNPASASSLFQASFAPGQLQWPARPWTTYEVEGSDNLQSWRVLQTVIPTGANGTDPNPPATASIPWVPGTPEIPRFLRIRQRR